MQAKFYSRSLLWAGILCAAATGAAKVASANTTPVSVSSTVSNAPHSKEKYTICHKGHEISVAESAVAAHLAHGDSQGSCRPTPPPPISRSTRVQ